MSFACYSGNRANVRKRKLTINENRKKIFSADNGRCFLIVYRGASPYHQTVSSGRKVYQAIRHHLSGHQDSNISANH